MVIKHVKPERVSDNPLAVESVEFWRERVFKFIAQGKMLHAIIYDDSYDLWQYVQGETAGHLRRHVKNGERVLDVGCGYGALLCCFQQAGLHEVKYTGLDISPDLLELAEYRYGDKADPNLRLLRGEFYRDDVRDFRIQGTRYDWAIARSVEGMILENRGKEPWEEMLAAMKRLAKRVMLLDYPAFVGDRTHVEIIEGRG